jgi:hypothetical protein
MENLISAQTTNQPNRPSPPRAPAAPDRWTPPVGASPCPHSLPSLSLSRSLPVGPTCRRRSVPARARSLPLLGGPLLSALTAHSRVLSLCPWTPPVSPSASLTSRPHTPPWTRPHRAFPGHLRTHPTSF